MLFFTLELINWPAFESKFLPELRLQEAFKVAKEEDLHKRGVEHNIRVIAKYYGQISTSRLSVLLNLSPDETEKALSEQVVAQAVYAKIDRPAGIVSFARRKDPNEILNDWSGNITKLLNSVESTCHLIHKENMLQQLKDLQAGAQ